MRGQHQRASRAQSECMQCGTSSDVRLDQLFKKCFCLNLDKYIDPIPTQLKLEADPSKTSFKIRVSLITPIVWKLVETCFYVSFPQLRHRIDQDTRTDESCMRVDAKATFKTYNVWRKRTVRSKSSFQM
ncbi:hypothetical protein PGT21_017079 [Puccinia graminis f. sp. tritici]|uniref:Uncharacterized protein n=1 Tax=Puccinia graminis f. sp. tritici TaxID=56615 RepID=A0A5B0NLH2_PUCGR|nr:hypothetical protein PGT21_017079 [Puccinia graminis f. sp. tritici]